MFDRTRRRRLYLAPLLLLCACGVGSPSLDADENSPAGLEQAASRNYRQFLDGDYTQVYLTKSDDCRSRQSFDDYVARARFNADRLVMKHELNDVTDLEVFKATTRNVAAGEGEVALWISPRSRPDELINDDPSFERWTYEDSRWRHATCA